MAGQAAPKETMKAVSNFLNRTPWWALLAGGLTLLIALGIFTTPFHLIQLDKSGATPAENRAIKSEINSAFSENALDLARGVVKEMRDHTRDPVRRDELAAALTELDQARQSLREADAEVTRAKNQAAEDVRGAVKEARNAIVEAQREAARALKDAGVERDKVQKSLEESLDAAKRAEDEAATALSESKAAAPAKKPRVLIMGPSLDKPLLDIDMSAGAANASAGTPLPAELKQEIRKKVTGDLYRIGVGAGLILLFIPLFVILIVSKFFIDRSRAAQNMVELKRKEAEYHRMSQQVTEAKLSALQAQVEPHFLYNTLASVQALTEVDPQQANAMTGHLIQYLRNALPKMRESVSTVGQEIELVRAYLNILQMRMGKRLAFEIDVPPGLMDAPFPPLMLPSLVENAIKHGLEPLREGGKVSIRASANGILRVSVSDTGRGFAETLGSGVGLTNIRERLAALYGNAGKLTLEAREAGGVEAAIEVPREGTRPNPAGGSIHPGAAVPALPAAPQTAAAKTLAAMGTAERAWRKGLSFAFVVLVVVAAVLAGLGMVGVATGVLPVQIGDDTLGGATGALVGTAGIAAGFAVVVLCLAIVLAVVYGLGFLFAGIAIFVPLVVLVSLFPVLAPFILVALGIWWLMRRNKRKAEAAAVATKA
jgi:hypothetical protein